jgi:Flp pilus assembly protein TadG
MLRPRTRTEDGAAVVEFAAIFGLFMMLVWAIIAFGAFWGTQQAITHAAAEAARAMVGALDAEATATERVAEQLGGIGQLGQEYTVDVTSPVTCGTPDAGAQCRTVTVTWIGDPIVPALFNVPALSHPSSSASVAVD